jgi:hypothetical protein
VRHVPRGAPSLEPDGDRVRMHQVPWRHRGVGYSGACGRRHVLCVLPPPTRLRASREGDPLRDVPRVRDQAGRHEPGAQELYDLPRRRRAPREACPGVRDVSRGGAVHRARRAPGLRRLPRAPLRRASKHCDLCLVPCAGGGRQARARRRRLRDVPSSARAGRRRDAARVRDLP